MGRPGGRVRLRGQKGKRWQKGQSSSSNPHTHKHRNAARGKFGGHLSQVNVTSHEGEVGATLTTDALASHDAIQGEKDYVQLNRYGCAIR
jgi:ribosomal RNA-processing protein 12